jgi:high affinity sulfate transporter 1
LASSAKVDEDKRQETKNWRRFLPILTWSRAYRREWLTDDVIAGITVGTFAIPECLAYASLAGLPLQVGLYAEIAALGIYLLFGTSRELSVGTTSALSILVGGTLGAMALSDPSLYWSFASLTAILVGVFALGAYVLKMGFIVRLISNPVLTGFTTGAALYIASSQISKLVGIPNISGNFFDHVDNVIMHLSAANFYSLAIGLGSIVALFAMRRISRRIPGAIIVVIATILLFTFSDLGSKGVAIVGHIPEGLPVPGIPDVSGVNGDQWATLITLALACLLLAYIEGMGIARSYAQKDGKDLNANQELLALSGINLASGLTHGFSVGGSVSRSAVNHQSQARTQLASGFAAVAVIVVTVFLTPLFANLPETVLAAVVIYAVAHLVNIAEMRRIYAVSKRHFAVAIVAFFTVLWFGLLIGIIVGIILSTINLLERVYKPHTARLGLEADTCSFEDVDMHPGATELPGLLVYRVDAPLVFMNSESVRDGAQNLIRNSGGGVHLFFLDLENCHEVDITAQDMILELNEWMRNKGVELKISNASDRVDRNLARSGLKKLFPDATKSLHEQLESWHLNCPRK